MSNCSSWCQKVLASRLKEHVKKHLNDSVTVWTFIAPVQQLAFSAFLWTGSAEGPPVDSKHLSVWPFLWPKTDPEIVLVKTFERRSKMLPRFYFLSSNPRSVTELFLYMALGGEAGAICRGRTARLHLQYTSQRPCWFIVILCCMIYMI